jgi:putative oxidoreductase
VRWDREHIELYAYTALRVVLGFLLVCHGVQHLFGVWTSPSDIGSQMWIGGILELGLGALVAIGFYTRLAAFILCGEMAVAYFEFHWKLKLGGGHFLPIVNKGELAVIYCFVLLFVWARGAGPYSVDRRRGHG